MLSFCNSADIPLKWTTALSPGQVPVERKWLQFKQNTPNPYRQIPKFQFGSETEGQKSPQVWYDNVNGLFYVPT